MEWDYQNTWDEFSSWDNTTFASLTEYLSDSIGIQETPVNYKIILIDWDDYEYFLDQSEDVYSNPFNDLPWIYKTEISAPPRIYTEYLFDGFGSVEGESEDKKKDDLDFYPSWDYRESSWAEPPSEYVSLIDSIVLDDYLPQFGSDPTWNHLFTWRESDDVPQSNLEYLFDNLGIDDLPVSIKYISDTDSFIFNASPWGNEWDFDLGLLVYLFDSFTTDDLVSNTKYIRQDFDLKNWDEGNTWNETYEWFYDGYVSVVTETVEDHIGLDDSISDNMDYATISIEDILNFDDSIPEGTELYFYLGDDLNLDDSTDFLGNLYDQSLEDDLGLQDTIQDNMDYAIPVNDDLTLDDVRTQQWIFQNSLEEECRFDTDNMRSYDLVLRWEPRTKNKITGYGGNGYGIYGYGDGYIGIQAIYIEIYNNATGLLKRTVTIPVTDQENPGITYVYGYYDNKSDNTNYTTNLTFYIYQVESETGILSDPRTIVSS